MNWVSGSQKNVHSQSLVSISQDGLINEWTLKKGIECNQLKQIQYTPNPKQKAQGDTINFRFSAGLSIDFLLNDSNIFFISTEDNTIHKCSKSYKEQYLQNYYGHKGAIYKIRLNPHCQEYFLTCSADWNCKLWNWKEKNCLLTFKNLDLKDEVLDIEWSPFCSTMFGLVAQDGRFEIWDFAKKSLDPIFVELSSSSENASKNCIKFNRVVPVVLTGDNSGVIQNY